MSYVYIRSEIAGHGGAEHDLYTVGFYKPGTPLGSFVPESDHATAEQAAARISYLNGGSNTEAYERLINAFEELRTAIDRMANR
jgi:hypothetical protein